MKLLMTAICFSVCFSVCLAQHFPSFAKLKEHCESNPDEETTATENDRKVKMFEKIKGISSQALDDFKKTTKQNCILYHPLLAYISEILLRDLKGHEKIIDASDANTYLKRLGVVYSTVGITTDLNEMIKEADKIPVDKLEPERKARLVIFIRGLANEATLDDAKATFAYLYGTPN